MDEQYERPTVPVEFARRMELAPIKHNCVFVNVQGLFGARNSETPTRIVPQTEGNRRKALKVVVCMGGAYGVAVELDSGMSCCSSWERTSPTIILIDMLLRAVLGCTKELAL